LDQRQLDVDRRPPPAGAVELRRLEQILGDRRERTVHDDDPASGTRPERDQGEDHREVAGCERVAERLVPSQRKMKFHGLSPGCSTNSQSITLAEPASAAGR